MKSAESHGSVLIDVPYSVFRMSPICPIGHFEAWQIGQHRFKFHIPNADLCQTSDGHDDCGLFS
jgi:hypothetical protein